MCRTRRRLRFKGLSQKSRLVSGTDPNLDLLREFAPFPGKSGASQMLPQGVVAEILRFAVSREEGCRNRKEIRPVILSVILL